jgi:hypothetical protein
MGQLTVIKPDSLISVSGIGVQECDMSGFPDDLHALQWDGTSGHVEYASSTKLNLSINSEAELESALGVSQATLIARREKAREALGPYHPLNNPLLLPVESE